MLSTDASIMADQCSRSEILSGEQTPKTVFSKLSNTFSGYNCVLHTNLNCFQPRNTSLSWILGYCVDDPYAISPKKVTRLKPLWTLAGGIQYDVIK